MTRQEALTVIKDNWSALIMGVPWISDALRVAMDALRENRQVTGKLDLISRQAALDCFHDWVDRHGEIHTADEMPEYQAIENLPSTQPEVIRCKE